MSADSGGHGRGDDGGTAVDRDDNVRDGDSGGREEEAEAAEAAAVQGRRWAQHGHKEVRHASHVEGVQHRCKLREQYMLLSVHQPCKN